MRASQKVMNLSLLLRQSAQRLGDEIGLVWGEETWTWARIDARADALACALAGLGVRKGDRVLVQSKNSNQLLESMFACFRLGAVWVPANFRQTPGDIAQIAQTSGASVMICQAEFAAHAEASRAAAESLRTVIEIGETGPSQSYEALVEAHMGEVFDAAAVEHDDPCWFFFTSGTTGKAKAAVLTHGQMGFVVTNQLSDLMPGLTPQGDASLVVAPLTHGAGIHLLAQVARGVKSILLPTDGLDPAEAWELVERWRVTNMFTVPTIVKVLTEHSAVDGFDHSSLKYVIYSGSPMYREDQKHALRKLGKVLVQYFGLGEVTGNITVLPAALHEVEDGPGARVGTCGYARTAMQLSIQDEEGRELAAGETGEICVCGPAVFAGYYDNPDANAQAFRAGWFRTGDLGHLDAEGFLFITGRASDMYISGGSNVYPREIEEKILTHPAIAQAAVVGVPDRKWGEVGLAVCVLKPGAELDAADFLGWIGQHVARYKAPRQVLFWDDLPKSAYGKIGKKIILEELRARGVI